jgi:predicted branched-subunit amino acid permease
VLAPMFPEAGLSSLWSMNTFFRARASAVPLLPPRTRQARGSSSHRIEKAALGDVAPILVGLIPFAGIIGITMARMDIPVATGVAGSALIFAGSAQLAILGLLSAGAGIIPMLLSVVLINSRFAMYGGAIEPCFRNQPRWFRWLGPHFLVDQNYGLVRNAKRDLSDPTTFRRYWMTISTAIGATWLATIAAVMILGGAIPADSPLHFAATGIYIALLVPVLKGRPALAAAGSAALTAWTFVHVAPGLGILAGVAVGIGVAATLEKGAR